MAETAAASTTAALRRGEFSLLSLELPGEPDQIVGVVLRDGDRLAIRLRPGLDRLAEHHSELDDEELDALALVGEQIQTQLQEQGPAALEWLEGTLSNILRISEREAVTVGNFDTTLTRLYQRHVPSEIAPFRTHLPLYSCRAAAGAFSEQMQVEQAEGDQGWIEAPEGMSLREGMFVAEVTGRSMEPRIPDGSLCIFRAPVVGSRHGRLVLVENLTESDTGGERYTIKRYHRPPGTHAVVMQPLNPAYEPWEIDEEAAEAGQIRVIAEFVQVLE